MGRRGDGDIRRRGNGLLRHVFIDHSFLRRTNRILSCHHPHDSAPIIYNRKTAVARLMRQRMIIGNRISRSQYIRRPTEGNDVLNQHNFPLDEPVIHRPVNHRRYSKRIMSRRNDRQ
ncbi:hypothetical protein D3C79_930410 [compost metagenome]